MKRIRFVALFLLGLGGLPFAVASVDWLTDADQAFALAQKEGKPILVAFTGSDWCPHCKRLEAEVFRTDAFEEAVRGKLVLLRMDTLKKSPQAEAYVEQLRALKRKYLVVSYPTIIVFDSVGGKLARFGYKKHTEPLFFEHLNAALAQ